MQSQPRSSAARGGGEKAAGLDGDRPDDGQSASSIVWPLAQAIPQDKPEWQDFQSPRRDGNKISKRI